MRALSVSMLLLLSASRASATAPPNLYENGQSYPLGSRAAGMGGAYTALACDEAALHYNPAALGCAARSRVEIAANAYMLQRLDSPDALGPGQDISATSYHPLPSIAGFVRRIGDGIGVGFSVSVPRSIFLAVDPPHPEQKDYFAITVRDDLLVADLGAGWQVTPSLAIGASLGGLLRTSQSHSEVLLVRQSASPCAITDGCFDFVASTSDTELLSLGARAKLGVRWTPLSSLSLGLVFTTPTVDLYGSARLSTSTTFALAGSGGTAFGAVPERSRGSSDLALPGRIVLGAALDLPDVVLSLDLALALPRQARIARDLVPVVVEGVPPSDPPPGDTVLTSEIQPNISFGAEIALNEDVVLDFGAFTDLSSTSGADVEEGVADHIDMFGATFAVGLLGKQVRSWFGVSFEIGSGTTRVRDAALSFEQLAMGEGGTVESSYTRWNLVGTIGTSYAFIDDADIPEGK